MQRSDPHFSGPPPDRLSKPREFLLSLGMIGVLLLGVAFIWHAVSLGSAGLFRDLSETSRLYSANAWANAAIFSHMIAGALITGLAPLQLIPVLRRRWARLHRVSGRILVAAALLSALGGLTYMALRGTVGGAPMTIAFTLYGALVMLAAVQTLRMARARRWTAHRDWALRLFFPSIASLLYRVHYGLWFMSTGGVAVQDDFRGAFDLVNIWAFYLPYLLVLEISLARQGRGAFGGLRHGPRLRG